MTGHLTIFIYIQYIQTLDKHVKIISMFIYLNYVRGQRWIFMCNCLHTKCQAVLIVGHWSSIIINVHKFSNKSMYKTRESRSQWYKALHNSVIISYIEWFNILPWSCGSSSNFCIQPQLFLIAVTEAIIQHFFIRNAILIQKYISIIFPIRWPWIG